MCRERMFNSWAGILSPLGWERFPFKFSSERLRFGPKIYTEQMESPTTYWEEVVDLNEKKTKKTNQSSESGRNSSWTWKEMSCELKDVPHVRKCDMLLFSRDQSGSSPGLPPPAQCKVLAEACQKTAEGLSRSLLFYLSPRREKKQQHFKSRDRNGKINKDWLARAQRYSSGDMLFTMLLYSIRVCTINTETLFSP